jgi:hypothetical protein
MLMSMASAVEFIRDAEPGTRMTVRSRLEADPSGARYTDAVGYLRERTEHDCVIETRHGRVVILLDEVTAAKEVPPPPARRAPRHPLP